MPRFVRIVVIVFVTFVAILIVGILTLQTGWGGRQLASVVERQLEGSLDGEITIGGIGGNLLSSPTVLDVTITRDGQPLLTAERVDLRYDLVGILRGTSTLDEVTLTRPVIHLTHGPDGITLFELFATDEEQPEEPSGLVDIEPIVIVDGRIVIDETIDEGQAYELPRELRQVQARLGVRSEAERTAIHIHHLAFVGQEPRLVLSELSGAIRVGEGDIVLEQILLRTEGSELRLDGAIRNLPAGGGTR